MLITSNYDYRAIAFVVCVYTVGTVHNIFNHLYCEEVVEQQPVLYVNNNHNVNIYYLNNKKLVNTWITEQRLLLCICRYYRYCTQ